MGTALAYAQILLQKGLITEMQWHHLQRQFADQNSKALFLKLQEICELSEEELFKIISKELKLPYWSLSKLKNIQLSTFLFFRFSPGFLYQNNVFPVALNKQGTSLQVIVSDPLNISTREEIKDLAGVSKLALALSSSGNIRNALDYFFDTNKILAKSKNFAGFQTEKKEETISAQIGDYLISKKLGEGGMGIVFEAVHTTTRKEVAIKVLHKHLSTKERIVHRFRREAKALHHLTHPHFVEVLDMGYEDEHGFFIVMEKLTGSSLEKILKSSMDSITPSLVFNVFEQVCAAMDFAHKSGVIHRDLKPDNIFLIPDKQKGYLAPMVKILDFGVAKLSSLVEEEKLTKTGMTLGTPRYMAPEQAGEGKSDQRSDIYSMGVILFELLTGRPPFLGKNAHKVMLRHVQTTAPLLYEANDSISFPTSLVQLVEQVLAKSPDARPQSMQSLWDRLKTPLDELAQQLEQGYLTCIHKEKEQKTEILAVEDLVQFSDENLVLPLPDPFSNPLQSIETNPNNTFQAKSQRNAVQLLYSKNSVPSLSAISAKSIPTWNPSLDTELEQIKIRKIVRSLLYVLLACVSVLYYVFHFYLK